MKARVAVARTDPSGEISLLQDATQAMGWSLSDETAAQLVCYLDLLERWNTIYNLTSVRDRAGMRLQHVVDCLAVVAPLRRVAAALHGVPRRLLDVGSGGGLPGVVLAALFPDWRVVCVDSVGKKAAFVQQVAVQLGMANLHSVHDRVEALSLPTFGVVTARAFSSLSNLVHAADRQLASGGVFMAMKAKLPIEEIRDAPPGWHVFHVEQLHVPGLAAERCLVWLRQLVIHVGDG